ncbi:hypothetical protein GLV89_06595 [Halomonas alkaliantarctica]|nr:hypothetical protein [Halomonas alkaliantarctica]
MLKDRGSRRIPLSQVEVEHHMSYRAKALFLARPLSLKDPHAMTVSAIKALIIQHPPVVYEDPKSKSGAQFTCIGNLYSLHIAKAYLHSKEKVRVILVEAPLRKDVEALTLSLAFSADALNALSPKESPRYLSSLWQYIISHHPQYLEIVSEKLDSKAAFGEAFNVNRRDL